MLSAGDYYGGGAGDGGVLQSEGMLHFTSLVAAAQTAPISCDAAVTVVAASDPTETSTFKLEEPGFVVALCSVRVRWAGSVPAHYNIEGAGNMEPPQWRTLFVDPSPSHEPKTFETRPSSTMPGAVRPHNLPPPWALELSVLRLRVDGSAAPSASLQITGVLTVAPTRTSACAAFYRRGADVCGWTNAWACPGMPPGTDAWNDGMAEDNGSIEFECCCKAPPQPPSPPLPPSPPPDEAASAAAPPPAASTQMAAAVEFGIPRSAARVPVHQNGQAHAWRLSGLSYAGVEPSSGQHVSVDASASALFMRRDPLRYSDNSVKM